MLKEERTVEEEFTRRNATFTAYRVSFKICSSFVSDFVHRVHKEAKDYGKPMTPLKVWVKNGIHIQFCRDRDKREEQKIWTRLVMSGYVTWFDETAHVWKFERKSL